MWLAPAGLVSPPLPSSWDECSLLGIKSGQNGHLFTESIHNNSLVDNGCTADRAAVHLAYGCK